MADERVDFERIAENAVAAGLFRTDAAAVLANLAVINKYRKLPVTPLDSPYGNGPIAIRVLGQDVPEASVYAVRRNFTAANALLLPREETRRYIHQRFIADDVLRSPTLSALVTEYRAPRLDDYYAASVDAVLGSHFKDDALSFQVDGVDRTTHDRRLYTREEQIAGLRLVERHPELVLTILVYQAVIHDYCANLRAAFATLAQRPGATITAKDLTDVDEYARQWRTNNFTDELVPAAAIFLQHRIDAGARPTVDEEILQRAVGFIIANGAFRNWVQVPARIAHDHKERVNHFLCPAVGVVREQLLDGQLLHAIHAIVRRRLQRKDRDVQNWTTKIRAEANEKFQERNRQPEPQELTRLQQSVSVRLRDGVHQIAVDASFAVYMSGRQQPGDAVIEAPLGTMLSDLLKAAVGASADRGEAVFFAFNGRGYRVTPEKLEQFAARNLPRE